MATQLPKYILNLVLSVSYFNGVTDVTSKKLWSMKENKNLLMSKKSDLHKLSTPQTLPAKCIRPSKMCSFGKADFLLLFPCAGMWFASHEREDLVRLSKLLIKL